MKQTKPVNKTNYLPEVFGRNAAFQSLLKSTKTGKSLCVSGLFPVAKANVINALCRAKKKPALVIASDEREAQSLCNDLCCMGLSALVYPVRDYTFLEEISSRSHEYEHQRLKVLLKLLDGACDVAIACVDAACQLTVPRQVLRDAVLDLAEGTEISIDRAVRALTLLGYERFDAVDGSGQFSLRGGILDFFMPDSEYPVRAEFWGDEICDLSYFDLETQRRFKKAGDIRLTPSTEIIIGDRAALADKITRQAGLLRGKAAAKARERLYGEAERLRGGAMLANADKFIGQLYEKPECLLDYISRDSLLFVSEFSNVRERGRATDFQNAEQLRQAVADGVLAKGFDRYALTFGECMERFTAHGVTVLESFVHGSIPLPLSEVISFSAKQLSQWNGSYKQLTEDLRGLYLAGSSGVVLAGTPKAAKNLAESLQNDGYPAAYTESLPRAEKGRIYVMQGALSAGFELPAEKFFLISYGQTAYRPEKKRRRKKEGQEIYNLSELSPG
ncbi:MAG: transcription-repair coupling factor, partial [Ruminococcus sp.]|nr:transcription-repair coupling factor [Ruminococcus sp.]